MPQVRLIDENGGQVGIQSTDDALKYAWDKNLDLVEVAPDARPPVCRVMDYSKYRYEQEQKAKLARKHQSTITIKEIKLRPKIGVGDYATKRGHVIRFLKNRAKVKVTIMFRGREMTHPERGRDLLLRLAEDVKDLGVIESQPLQDGRNMVMMLAPHKAVVPAKPSPDAPAETPTDAPADEPADAGGRGGDGLTGRRDAKDEDDIGREEAVPDHGRRKGDAPARVQVAPARAQEPEAAPQRSGVTRARTPGTTARRCASSGGDSDGTRQAQRPRQEEASRGARAGVRLPRPQEEQLPQGERADAEVALLRLPRPAHAQA